MNKIQGGSRARKIGWLCSYVPEELILAAGFQPTRIVGRVEYVKQAESYMFPNFCPYLKNVLDSGLTDEYQDIEGIIFTNSCDGTRRLYDLWRNNVKTPFIHMLEVPKNRDESAVQYFSGQLKVLNHTLQEFSRSRESGDVLNESVSLMNEHRRLMTGFFNKQKAVPAPFTGTDLATLSLDAMTLLKEETSAKLRAVSALQRSSDNTSGISPRVLVTGNIVDKPLLFKMIEDSGATVVTFDTCGGPRHWEGQVELSANPIDSLARRYLLKQLCPRMPGLDQRIEQINRLIQDYAIDGVIYTTVKCCDYGLFEAPVVQKGLKNPKIPFLMIENDYVWGDEGRVKVRIEAFVEMMKDDLY